MKPRICKECKVRYHACRESLRGLCVYDHNTRHIYNTVIKKNLCGKNEVWGPGKVTLI